MGSFRPFSDNVSIAISLALYVLGIGSVYRMWHEVLGRITSPEITMDGIGLGVLSLSLLTGLTILLGVLTDVPSKYHVANLLANITIFLTSIAVWQAIVGILYAAFSLIMEVTVMFL
jgi:hypothetical protein